MNIHKNKRFFSLTLFLILTKTLKLEIYYIIQNFFIRYVFKLIKKNKKNSCNQHTFVIHKGKNYSLNIKKNLN